MIYHLIRINVVSKNWVLILVYLNFMLSKFVWIISVSLYFGMMVNYLCEFSFPIVKVWVELDLFG